MIITGFEYLIRDTNENISELAKKLDVDVKTLNKWMFAPNLIPKLKLKLLIEKYNTTDKFILNKFEIKIDKRQIIESHDYKKDVIFENFDKILGSMRKEK